MPSPAPRSARTAVARFLGFALLQLLAVQVGRATFDPQLGLSLVWPVHGVGVLWLATSTRRGLPVDAAGFVLVTFSTVLLTDGSWERALLGVVAGLAAAATWILVMRRFAPDLWGAGGSRPIGRLRDLGAFLAACGVAAAASAAIRAHGIWLLPPLEPAEGGLTVIRNLSWIMGICALGLLALPQPDLGVRRWWAAIERRALRVTETVIVLAAATYMSVTVFSPEPPPFAFPLLLGAVWSAFRLPAAVAVALSLVSGSYAVVATLVGWGPFVTGQPLQSAAIPQAFVVTLVLTTLAISFAGEDRGQATRRAVAAEREARARATMFSTAIEHLTEGVTVINGDDSYSVRNSAARRLTGRGGFLAPDLSDPDQPVMVAESGEPVPVADMPHTRARNGEVVEREVVLVRTVQGERRHLEISSIPVSGIGDDADPVVVNTIRDVTREHEERDQLVAFAGVVAHDLKNPLTVVRGWAESIHEELDDAAQPDVATLRSMVARVQSAADQMRHFIDDLLDFTVSRDRPLRIEQLDLSALAEEVADLRREAELRPRVTVEAGLKACGDRFLVRQLLDNLIGNAVKYVAPGVRPTVTVTAVEVGDMVEVSVTDNGVGIPVEARQRVFDSFVRAHGADFGGTGLGLAICQRVVQRHGGRIWVAEDQPEGTRISFTLPLR